MGSGETTPGMLGVHREVFADLPAGAQLALMDSPFAFQENADELVDRISGYFDQSLGRTVQRITLPAGADALTQAQALAAIRSADWLFAGPGSPSYARRAWVGTPVPQALADLVAPGRSAALVVASAAAVTLGSWALPVYEIYKVGEDPRWEPGIGVMDRVLGWRCAVIPHYDNQEGGTHDTRFCYLGGRRLARIEDELDGALIVGVDEHTAVLFDLDAGRVRVAGRGGLTLRVAGVEEVLPAGTEVALTEVETLIDRLRGVGNEPGAVLVASQPDPAVASAAGEDAAQGSVVGASASPSSAAGQGASHTSAGDGDSESLPAGDGDSQASASGDRDLQGSAPGDGDSQASASGDGDSQASTAGQAASRGLPAGEGAREGLPAGDAASQAPAELARVILDAIPESAQRARVAVVDLLRGAEDAAERHDRELAGHAVQAVVDLRAEARASGDWVASDRLRDVLTELGVEVRDARDGSTWSWS